MIMVIAGHTKRIAFYCRMNHRDMDNSQFLDEVKSLLDQKYGKENWELNLYFEVASGTDPNRRKFNELKADIKAGKIEGVVSVSASMIARDWQQFMEFMKICEKAQVEVSCIRGLDDAAEIYQRICTFVAAYAERRSSE